MILSTNVLSYKKNEETGLEAWNSSELIVPSESFSARRLCFGPPFDINLGWVLEKVI